MTEWQNRVISEKEELDNKITKLKEFLSSDKDKELDNMTFALLTEQCYYMQEYSIILEERIKHFKKD